MFRTSKSGCGEQLENLSKQTSIQHMILLFQNAASKISPFLNVRAEAQFTQGGNFCASQMKKRIKRNKTINFLSVLNIISKFLLQQRSVKISVLKVESIK